MKTSFSIESHVLQKIAVFSAISYFFVGQILPGVFDMVEESHTLSTLDVSPAMRTRVTTSLADALAKHYLDADKGAQLAASVRQSAQRGDYDSLSSPSQLARALSADLQSAASDTHLSVEFSAATVPDEGDRGIDHPPDDDGEPLPLWLINRLGRTMANFGVQEVSQSASGIAYICLDAFFRPYLAAEKYAAAMDRVADSRALIIDLRTNGGGKSDSVPLLASYFFDRPTHLSDIEYPRTGERRAMWTRTDVEGTRYGSTRPVFILTSHQTHSAAEDFAYAMQTRRRATIVGETTHGGAHPVTRYRLDPHFIVHMPTAQSISPITHTNWERKGVQPDVRVPAGSALETATALILRQARKTAARGDINP